MDLKSVSTKITDATKLGRESIKNTLDAVAPTFAPFAARWDAEAERRRQLRTPENLRRLMDAQRAYNSARSTAAAATSQRRAARTASTNPLSAARRAARTADRAARQEVARTRAALREARRQYPATLASVAVQAHAVHAVPAAGLTAVGWEHVGAYPASVSAALIALNAGALWLGRRQPRTVVDDGLSAEERRLMERLDPAYWVAHADERGLSGTVPSPAEVTPAGLVSHVRLDGRWTPKGLQAKADEIRALLGARTDLRMEIKAGSHGDRAMIVLRTRSAADGDDLKWSHSVRSFGVDTVTGEHVTVPLGERLLIAGRSGAGKSVASRPLLFDASESDTTALVIIDLKKVEGRLWDHRARVASTPDEVVTVVDELVTEMTERLEVLPKGQATWTPTPERPRLTVVVDEGAELVTAAKDALEGLESIARMGRAACVDLWWMTQKPTIGDGIPKQIAPQMSTRICLAVSTPAEARVVLGEDAQAKGWAADELPAPGVAYVRDGKRKPHPIRVRFMDDSLVIALPARPIWRRESAQVQVLTRPALRLVKDEPPAPVLSDADRAVLDAVRAAGGPIRQAKVVTASGLAKGTVSKAVKRLVDAGLLARTEDGALVAAAGEVSA